MSYKTIKANPEIEVVDIPTMASMPINDYTEYIEDGLFFVDHHDILRALPGAYPIACDQKQLQALIDYLEEIKSRMTP